MVLQLLHQWREAGGGERFPKLNEIDRAALGDIWDDCYVLDVDGDADDARFTTIGKAISDSCEEDFSSRRVSDVPTNTLLHQSASQATRVLQKAVPISMGGKFENAAGQTVLFRSILLPLSDDSEVIRKLLGAANSRVLAED